MRQFKYGAQEAREAFDLIEAIHVALRMLEELDRRERGGFVVAGVRRGGRKRGGEVRGGVVAMRGEWVRWGEWMVKDDGGEWEVME